ncbi:TetR/AcrR family transcriptional regulator [Peribacillus sp. SCS-155]|uniref:TetR/AcrR family transcriptional regulator n=1 Tax=Peribacillus sedimenti TaxID=3115297 RepID=UPI00390631D2
MTDEYKEKKKKEILASARACFARKGFESSTMDDIVAQSGISKGAIYNYFKSKDEIYLELMSVDTNEAYAYISQSISRITSTMAKIEFLFDEYLSFNPADEEAKGKNIVHTEFKLHSSRKEHLNRIMNTRRKKFFVDFVASILKEGQEHGEIQMDIDPELFSNLFWSMIDGAVLQTVYPDFPYKKVLQEIKNLFTDKVRI